MASSSNHNFQLSGLCFAVSSSRAYALANSMQSFWGYSAASDVLNHLIAMVVQRDGSWRWSGRPGHLFSTISMKLALLSHPVGLTNSPIWAHWSPLKSRTPSSCSKRFTGPCNHSLGFQARTNRPHCKRESWAALEARTLASLTRQVLGSIPSGHCTDRSCLALAYLSLLLARENVLDGGAACSHLTFLNLIALHKRTVPTAIRPQPGSRLVFCLLTACVSPASPAKSSIKQRSCTVSPSNSSGGEVLARLFATNSVLLALCFSRSRSKVNLLSMSSSAALGATDGLGSHMCFCLLEGFPPPRPLPFPLLLSFFSGVHPGLCGLSIVL